jgi:hypothetical protein
MSFHVLSIEFDGHAIVHPAGLNKLWRVVMKSGLVI